MVAEADSDPNDEPNLPVEGNPGDPPQSNELLGDIDPNNSNDNSVSFNSPTVQRAGTIPVSAIDSERRGPRNPPQFAGAIPQINFDESETSQSSNHEISDVSNDELERRVAARLLGQEQLRLSLITPAINSSALPTSKYIDKRSYKETSPQTVTEIFALRLFQFGPQKARNLRSMHNILASTGLLTMLLEQRTKPVVTDMNTFGFTLPHTYIPVPTTAIDDDIDNDSISTYALSTNGDYIPICEDDIGLFTYDKARLMRLVEYMFDKSIQSYGEKHMDKDTVQRPTVHISTIMILQIRRKILT